MRGEPERRCLATGEVQPKRGLIRFAVSPDGVVVPDILEKLPGRGLWVHAERDALETVIKKKLFSRGAKAQVTVPDGQVWLKTCPKSPGTRPKPSPCTGTSALENGCDWSEQTERRGV